MDEATAPCDLRLCRHPSRYFGIPPIPEGRCECHSWNLTYLQRTGATACHRNYPEDFVPPLAESTTIEYRVMCAKGMGPSGVHERGEVSFDAVGVQSSGPEPLDWYDANWRCGPHRIERRVITVTPWSSHLEEDT